MTEIYLNKYEMPNSCDECRFTDRTSEFPNVVCNITNELVNDDEDFEYERHSTCPLRVLTNG